MSARLKDIITAEVNGISGSTSAGRLNRVKIAIFYSMISPEYLIQR
jgi:hypothetical protein